MFLIPLVAASEKGRAQTFHRVSIGLPTGTQKGVVGRYILAREISYKSWYVAEGGWKAPPEQVIAL